MSWREREKEVEKNMPFKVATYVSACSPRAVDALRSDQNTAVGCHVVAVVVMSRALAGGTGHGNHTKGFLKQALAC